MRDSEIFFVIYKFDLKIRGKISKVVPQEVQTRPAVQYFAFIVKAFSDIF